MSKQVKRALFSLDNTKGVERFARVLEQMGWQLIATSETAKRLKRSGIKVSSVAGFTGVKQDYHFPPTLHPKMEAALTEDVPFKIDLVYDLPYPLSKGNDVGGRTLLALGAKGARIVVCCYEDVRQVIKQLKQDREHLNIARDYRQQLIDKVNFNIAQHYLTLARRQGNSIYDGYIGKAVLNLANGENPYQLPAELFNCLTKESLSLSNSRLLGKSLPCFTNLADLDSIMHTLCLAASAFYLKYNRVPYIAVVAKHGNPCGISFNWHSPQKAIVQALWGNPRAIWGGEFISNFKINKAEAGLLFNSAARKKKLGSAYWMLDIIFAPGFDKAALKILGGSQNRKLVQNPGLLAPKLANRSWQYRWLRAGFLRQPTADYILVFTNTESNSGKIADKVLDYLILAWSVVFSSNHGGNEVALVKDTQLLAVAGGPSTVEAAKTALLRAKENGHNPKGSVFAADAFFPFTDAPKILSKAGCIAGVVPGGGKNEGLIKKYFQRQRIKLFYIPAQYRGFCRH